jgi:short subunit fatty acids transporter
MFLSCPELADSFENMIHDNVDVYSLEVLLRNAFEFMVMYMMMHSNNKQVRCMHVFIHVSSFDAFPKFNELRSLLVSHVVTSGRHLYCGNQ